MGIMRWALYEKLREHYPDVSLTYGYITKNTRIRNGLEQSKMVDARCISGNPLAEPCKEFFLQKKIRRHNRQIHKLTISKGGKRKVNQAAYLVKGFRLFDKVKFEGKECFIFGRRSSGYFDIRTLNGERIQSAVSWKKLKLLERRSGMLTERRVAG